MNAQVNHVSMREHVLMKSTDFHASAWKGYQDPFAKVKISTRIKCNIFIINFKQNFILS